MFTTSLVVFQRYSATVMTTLKWRNVVCDLFVLQ